MPSLTAEIAIEAESWRSVWPEHAEALPRLLDGVAPRLADRLPERGEISLLLTDDATIAGLNRDWRGKDRATNVLSFPLQDGAAEPGWPAGEALPLGDIVLALETCRGEAEALRRSLPDHALLLTLHGVLHLLGFDHEQDADADRMEALERELAGMLALPDPYPAPDDDDRPDHAADGLAAAS